MHILYSYFHRYHEKSDYWYSTRFMEVTSHHLTRVRQVYSTCFLLLARCTSYLYLRQPQHKTPMRGSSLLSFKNVTILKKAGIQGIPFRFYQPASLPTAGVGSLSAVKAYSRFSTELIIYTSFKVQFISNFHYLYIITKIFSKVKIFVYGTDDWNRTSDISVISRVL